jgi:hypothetical protein
MQLGSPHGALRKPFAPTPALFGYYNQLDTLLSWLIGHWHRDDQSNKLEWKPHHPDLPPQFRSKSCVQSLLKSGGDAWGNLNLPRRESVLLSNSEPLGGQATASLVCLAPTLARVVPTRSFLSAIDARRLSKLLLFEGFNLAPRSRQHCEIPRLKSSSKWDRKAVPCQVASV